MLAAWSHESPRRQHFFYALCQRETEKIFIQVSPGNSQSLGAREVFGDGEERIPPQESASFDALPRLPVKRYSDKLFAKGEPEAGLKIQKGEKREQEKAMRIKKALKKMRFRG